jgi:hypothetical protein
LKYPTKIRSKRQRKFFAKATNKKIVEPNKAGLSMYDSLYEEEAASLLVEISGGGRRRNDEGGNLVRGFIGKKNCISAKTAQKCLNLAKHLGNSFTNLNDFL